MSTHLLESYGMQILEGGISADDQLRWQVRELLSGLYPAGPFERRYEQRYPFPKLIQLRPVGPDGKTPTGPAVTVSGKQISEAGLSFFSPGAARLQARARIARETEPHALRAPARCRLVPLHASRLVRKRR